MVFIFNVYQSLFTGRETPSVAGIINPGSEGFQKLFFGQEEIAVPVHSACVFFSILNLHLEAYATYSWESYEGFTIIQCNQLVHLVKLCPENCFLEHLGVDLMPG